MARKMKEKIAHSKKQIPMPGVPLDSPCMDAGRAWLVAKEEFCEAREGLMDAQDICLESMEKAKVKRFTCEGSLIELTVKDASKKLKAKKIDISDE